MPRIEEPAVASATPPPAPPPASPSPPPTSPPTSPPPPAAAAPAMPAPAPASKKVWRMWKIPQRGIAGPFVTPAGVAILATVPRPGLSKLLQPGPPTSSRAGRFGGFATSYGGL